MMIYEKVTMYVITGLLCISLIYGTVTTVRCINSIQSLEQCRAELEQARTRNEQYAETYREARSTNTELGVCLSRSVTTLSELREQLQRVRELYEKMETRLYSVGDNDTDNCNNNDFKKVEGL